MDDFSAKVDMKKLGLVIPKQLWTRRNLCGKIKKEFSFMRRLSTVMNASVLDKL